MSSELVSMSAQEVESLEKICQKLLKSSSIRFAGTISRLGRLVAGGFKPGVVPHIEEEKERMMYMQLVLDVSMRKDFDEYLGSINYVLCERENVTMISIPRQNYLVLIFLERNTNYRRVVNKTQELLQKEGLK